MYSMILPFFRQSRFRFLLFLLSAILIPASASLRGAEVRYLTGLGSGIAGQIGFRTEVELLNEHLDPVEGTLSFFLLDDSSLDSEMRFIWVGKEGEVGAEGNRIEFLLPPASSLLVIIDPVRTTRIGWAKLVSDQALDINSSVQVSSHSRVRGPELRAFEHDLKHQAELKPTTGEKLVSFPIWLFEGFQRINTAFSVVNVAGVPGKVQLTYRPDVTREIQLQPGEMVSDYFDSFWSLGFPEIFPYSLRASAQITSQLPLGITVFRTLNGLPLSGVETVRMENPQVCSQALPDLPFQLKVDECASIGARLQIQFWSVNEDSRCPIDVTCVWEGRVEVELRAVHEGEPATVFLSLDKAGSRAEIGSYEVELQEVLPVPVSTQPRTIEDYSITLTVRPVKPQTD